MHIKVNQINVDSTFINPNLIVDIDVHYTRDQAITSAVGRLLVNGVFIATLQEAHLINRPIDYFVFGKSFYEKLSRRDDFKTTRSVKLFTELSPKAINRIEEERDKSRDKSITLSFDIAVRGLAYKLDSDSVTEQTIFGESYHDSKKIEQSEWINNFAEKLGIGKFLLLELPIEEHKSIPVLWSKLIPRLQGNLVQAEQAIKRGDWQNCMFHMRKFYENIKIGDNKPGNAKFKAAFSKLLKNDLHTNDGVQDLYDALWKFFEFNSKFVHDRAKDGSLTVEVNVNKEDAYLAYSLGIALINFLTRKVIRYHV